MLIIARLFVPASVHVILDPLLAVSFGCHLGATVPLVLGPRSSRCDRPGILPRLFEAVTLTSAVAATHGLLLALYLDGFFAGIAEWIRLIVQALPIPR